MHDAEWSTLDAATKAALEAVIRECQVSGRMVRRPHGPSGEVFAYPHKEGTAWGYDGPPHGCNIARGVRPCSPNSR